LSYIPAEPSQEGAEADTFFRWTFVPVTSRAGLLADDQFILYPTWAVSKNLSVQPHHRVKALANSARLTEVDFRTKLRVRRLDH